MKKYLKCAPWAMVGLVVLALFMIFAPQIKTEGGNGWDGIEVVFGSSLYGEEVLKFSFMNMLTYVFLVATAIFSVVSYVKEDKNCLVVAIICSFLAALFFFLTKSFIVPIEEIKALIQQYCSLDVGAIIGGVSCLLSSGVGVAKLVLDK